MEQSHSPLDYVSGSKVDGMQTNDSYFYFLQLLVDALMFVVDSLNM